MRWLYLCFVLTCVPAGAAWAQTPQPPPPPPDAPAPAPPAAEDATFWLSEGGKTSATAYSIAELKAMIRDGRLTRETYVFRVGAADWTRAGAEPSLLALFASVPPPPSKIERHERFMVGVWRFDDRPQQGFAIWYFIRYAPDQKLYVSQFTALQDGVTQPTRNDYAGTWRIVNGVSDSEFVIEQSVAGRTQTINLRVVDRDTVTDVANGNTSVRVR